MVKFLNSLEKRVLDMNSEIVRSMKSNIDKCDNNRECNIFFVVSLIVEADNFNKIEAYFPLIDNSESIKLIKIAQDTINSLKKYYTNIAQKYNSELEYRDIFLDKLSLLEKEFNSGCEIDDAFLLNTFKKYEINLNKFYIAEFKRV